MTVLEVINKYFPDKNSREENPKPLYQPVFGHAEFDYLVKNNNYGELVNMLIGLIKQYQQATNKKIINILDIGSAEGYIDFCLKKEFGNNIHITCYEENTVSLELSNAINEELQFDISFKKSPTNNFEYTDNLKDQEFDIVFLFNVLHWISIQDKGWQNTKTWLNILAQKSNILLLELAGYDYNNLIRCPREYDEWFTDILFYYRIAQFKHFVDNFNRPLYIASNKFIYSNNSFYPMDSHYITFNGMRRAFLSQNHLIKILYKNVPNSFGVSSIDCITELKNEIKRCSLNFSFSPKNVFHEETDDAFISVLKLKKIGITNLKPDIYNYKKTCQKIINILDNLIELEENNLYHYDLTTWNIMETKSEEAFLVDIGAIIPGNIVDGGNRILNQICKSSHYNSYDAFMSIVVDLLSSNVAKEFESQMMHAFIPTVFFDENLHFPKGIKNFLKKFQALKRNELSFKKIKACFEDYVINEKELHMTKEENIIYGFEYEKRRIDQMHLQLWAISKLTQIENR